MTEGELLAAILEWFEGPGHGVNYVDVLDEDGTTTLDGIFDLGKLASHLAAKRPSAESVSKPA